MKHKIEPETGQQQITLLKRPVSGLTTTTAMEKNKNKDEMKTTATKRKTKSRMTSRTMKKRL
jgi:hypothetical protein